MKRREIKFNLVRPGRLNDDAYEHLFRDLYALLNEAWGEFDKSFLRKHIFHPKNRLVVAYKDGHIIGFCAVSKKNILDKVVYYIEFTVIKPKYQGYGLGPRMTFYALKDIFLRNLHRLMIGGIEIMLLTPNIRVLSKLARLASSIYPDPYQADPHTGEIPEADEYTWRMAKALIKMSDSPERKVDREGLVLHGSYAKHPWLIYNKDNAPWHYDEQINTFARKYLSYDQSADREFIVMARITYKSILNFINES